MDTSCINIFYLTMGFVLFYVPFFLEGIYDIQCLSSNTEFSRIYLFKNDSTLYDYYIGCESEYLGFRKSSQNFERFISDRYILMNWVLRDNNDVEITHDIRMIDYDQSSLLIISENGNTFECNKRITYCIDPKDNTAQKRQSKIISVVRLLFFNGLMGFNIVMAPYLLIKLISAYIRKYYKRISAKLYIKNPVLKNVVVGSDFEDDGSRESVPSKGV